MTCYNHPDRPTASFCRACGRGLCGECQRIADGTVFCPDHAPVPQAAYGGAGYPGTGYPGTGSTGTGYSGSAYEPYTGTGTGGAAGGGFAAGGPNPYAQAQPPYTAPAGVRVNTSPGLAFLLGFIPGVGAIYNGQYIKGLVHAGIFGLFVTLMSSNGAGAAEPLFGILLSAFIFYMPFEAFHTAKRRQSGMPVEEWSSLSRGPLPGMAGRTPIGPIVLISLGVLFLLDTMNLIEFRQVGRFWPVILIAIGAAMLYSRINPGRVTPGPYPGSYPNGPFAPPPPPPPMPGPGATPVASSELMETGRE